MAAKEISLKLFIQKEKNRVAFAESDKDFIDILFSFLTIPLGTMIKLEGKQSTIGCIDKLYQSVENLDTQYLQTKACKSMLLHPKNASEAHCDNLAIKIIDNESNKCFTCPNYDICRRKTNNLLSTVRNAQCCCGREMEKELYLSEPNDFSFGEGVFVDGTTRFVISDDLVVLPGSTEATLLMIKKAEVDHPSALEERQVNIGIEKVLNLLKSSLLSTTPLTDLFFPHEDEVINGTIFPSGGIIFGPHRMVPTSTEPRRTFVKLYLNSFDYSLLYAEAQEDFVDLLFSFLTFPIGHIVDLLTEGSSINNLRSSVEELSTLNYIKSGDCVNRLLNPELAQFHRCKNQPINIAEEHTYYKRFYVCSSCSTFGLNPTHDDKCVRNGFYLLHFFDPKVPNLTKTSGVSGRGVFLKGKVTYIITDELAVTPFSVDSSITLISKSNVPVELVEGKTVGIGEREVRALSLHFHFAIIW